MARAGIGLSVVAFVLAAVGGVWLAGQISSGVDVSPLLLLLLFVPVTVLAGSGIYLYVRGSQQEPSEALYSPSGMMRMQRDLVDLLRSSGQVQVSVAAAKLHTSPDTIWQVIDELTDLDLFTGYANREQRILHWVQVEFLRGLKHCLVCQTPIGVEQSPTVCSSCDTVYWHPDTQ